MQLDIQAGDFPLTDDLRCHAERRLLVALTCCDDHIQRVVMRLSDINSLRGGADKCCHLQVLLAGLPDVVIEDIETGLYVAIDRACDRAGRTLVRKLGQQQSLHRQCWPPGSDTRLSDCPINKPNRGNHP